MFSLRYTIGTIEEKKMFIHFIVLLPKLAVLHTSDKNTMEEKNHANVYINYLHVQANSFFFFFSTSIRYFIYSCVKCRNCNLTKKQFCLNRPHV